MTLAVKVIGWLRSVGLALVVSDTEVPAPLSQNRASWNPFFEPATTSLASGCSVTAFAEPTGPMTIPDLPKLESSVPSGL